MSEIKKEGKVATAEEVIHFWFIECVPQNWFQKNETFDSEVRERFLPTYEAVMADKTESWRTFPHGRLAEVIVLDQFARNMFRGKARAFAGDALALHLAKEAIEAQAHWKLSSTERRFLFMPFMHSESKDVHREALWRFATFLPKQWKPLRYEWQHKKTIDRFGRYPHRNEALGRTSTPEELEYLKKSKGF